MDKYSPPTPDQVRGFLRAHGLTGSMAAGLAGLSGSNKVRAYTGGARPTVVSYAVWFVWHAKTMLPPDVVDSIEAAMVADVEMKGAGDGR